METAVNIAALEKERRRQVALIVETSVVYGRQILSGIARYLRQYPGWSVFLDERELRAPPPDWLATWPGDGIICRSTTPEWAEIFRQRRVPVVDLNDQYVDLGLPRVASDMPAIGRLAAEHLLQRGFSHLAFCGFLGETWSFQRRQGFAEVAGDKLKLEHVLETRWMSLRERPYEEERNRIALWLQTLPLPVGIMACNDVRAQHVLDACRQLGLDVPRQVAVVGVDNAETFCELCEPPLSSVVPDAERIGYEAAALLDRLMAGKPAPARPLLLPPQGLVTRRSTDVYAFAEPVVARAMEFIRQNACQGIRVRDVLRHVNCSRSWLERVFRYYVGHSPRVEIRSVQLQKARELLLTTDWKLPQIAGAVGMENTAYFVNLFRRFYGQPPARYRRRHRVDHP
ncbi:DNA-binding transcriptional regulator [Fontisphaera persica]|uniref:AraC family transcriptional regulator n=1 Tax=Fontisphaera persica TaxID=2974023 RepID=UPI0024C06B62|nr:DNA-binding transcriptional regulator [Fontisphaera persica]WCJ58436.1 DNA-binding transcriptional regulator [Fontisphaera persica]